MNSVDKLDQVIKLVENSLLKGWDLLLMVGIYVSLFTIGIGVILWLTGFDTVKGKRLLLGGIILCIIVHVLSSISPQEIVNSVLR